MSKKKERWPPIESARARPILPPSASRRACAEAERQRLEQRVAGLEHRRVHRHLCLGRVKWRSSPACDEASHAYLLLVLVSAPCARLVRGRRRQVRGEHGRRRRDGAIASGGRRCGHQRCPHDARLRGRPTRAAGGQRRPRAGQRASGPSSRRHAAAAEPTRPRNGSGDTRHLSAQWRLPAVNSSRVADALIDAACCVRRRKIIAVRERRLTNHMDTVHAATVSRSRSMDRMHAHTDWHF